MGDMDEDDVFDDTLDDSGRVRLHTLCPAGHPTIQALTPRELQDGVLGDSLTFQCLYCGTRWAPTASQLSTLRSDFEG